MAASSNSQFLTKLCAELEKDEGVVHKIYTDHLGYLHFGIGHLITENDPEYGKSVGSPVCKERVDEVFKKDAQTALEGCSRLFPDFQELPEEAQLVIANMMFNLGETKLAKFVKFRAALEARDWSKAADEMVDSRWYKQVTTRANRLVARIRNLAD
uniref:Phage lysozyme 1 n=2 Tax=Sinohyriopsis cumingii TaxID=165450 RepID=A0A1N7TAU6_SINCU|nr:phage lysozyme 1 [Sinohyriopsis cumingii]